MHKKMFFASIYFEGKMRNLASKRIWRKNIIQKSMTVTALNKITDEEKNHCVRKTGE